MTDNVWEWVQDWYGLYDQNKTNNPVGPASGEYRVLCGGSWYLDTRYIRTANRTYNNPTNTNNHFGFRCISPP